MDDLVSIPSLVSRLQDWLELSEKVSLVCYSRPTAFLANNV